MQNSIRRRARVSTVSILSELSCQVCAVTAHISALCAQSGCTMQLRKTFCCSRLLWALVTVLDQRSWDVESPQDFLVQMEVSGCVFWRMQSGILKKKAVLDMAPWITAGLLRCHSWHGPCLGVAAGRLSTSLLLSTFSPNHHTMADLGVARWVEMLQHDGLFEDAKPARVRWRKIQHLLTRRKLTLVAALPLSVAAPLTLRRP